MVIGIPRAFLYYRYRSLWEAYFEALGHQIVVSPETNKEILARGVMLAIDEACLSSKIFLGHVDWLIGRCDAVFVPRIAALGPRDLMCTKFEALYDICAATFRDRSIKLLDLNIDGRHGKGELNAFLRLAKQTGNKKPAAAYAYMLAKQAERLDLQDTARRQELRLAGEDLKILVVGHGYNVRDAYIGRPVTDYLSQLGAIPIPADDCDRKLALERSRELTGTLPWTLNRELVGAVQQYRGAVDGIVLLSSFPCGPDSLVNDIISRRVPDVPILKLLLDNQEGSAGVETRLESFIDIIRFRSVTRKEVTV